MDDTPREILVTSALPCADGPIHLGHLVEYIQTNDADRFQRLSGHTCYYVCADDTHGTPIMLKAEAEGVSPERLIERMYANHLQDFTAFHIAFNNCSSTNSPGDPVAWPSKSYGAKADRDVLWVVYRWSDRDLAFGPSVRVTPPRLPLYPGRRSRALVHGDYCCRPNVCACLGIVRVYAGDPLATRIADRPLVWYTKIFSRIFFLPSGQRPVVLAAFGIAMIGYFIFGL